MSTIREHQEPFITKIICNGQIPKYPTSIFIWDIISE